MRLCCRQLKRRCNCLLTIFIVIIYRRTTLRNLPKSEVGVSGGRRWPSQNLSCLLSCLVPIGRSRAIVWGAHAECGAWTYNGLWGTTPSGVHAQSSWSGVQAKPHKLNAFCICTYPRSWPICPEIYFFQNKDVVGRLDPRTPSPLRIRQCSSRLGRSVRRWASVSVSFNQVMKLVTNPNRPQLVWYHWTYSPVVIALSCVVLTIICPVHFT